MNCAEVQERLSEYLEQALDEGNMRSVESHLSSCRLCRAEADSLALCIESIANLPTVEPPIGFAQRVMSHVREIEAKPALWQRFWSPLGSKLPIHVTAIVLIGIMTLYLFEKQRPDLPPPSERVTSTTPSREEQIQTPAPEPSTSTAAPKKPEGSSSVSENRKQSTATGKTQGSQAPSSVDKQQPRASSTSGKNAIGARSVPEEPETSSAPPLIPLDPRRRAGGVISGTPVVNPATPRIGAGPFSLPSELEAESFRVPSSSLARLADYELVLRRRPALHNPTLRDNIEPSQSNIDRLMAMIPDSTRPHIIWVSLAPSQLDQFKRELLSIGTIESESATSYRDLEFASKTGSEVLIRLTILPVSETSRTNPTQRAIR
jgi:hypothetical protein